MHAARKLETFEPLGLFDDLFEEAKLPVTMLTRAQLDRRRASPALACAYERFIPVAQIHVERSAAHSTALPSGVTPPRFELGREILTPIEVIFDQNQNHYRLLDGEKRLRQARLNRQTHILAFVEPDRGALIVGRRAIGAGAQRTRPDGASHFCYMNGAGVTEDYRSYDVYLHCLDAKRLLGRYGDAYMAWQSMNRKVEGSLRITIEEAETGTVIGLREGPSALIAFEYSLMQCKTHTLLKHAA